MILDVFVQLELLETRVRAAIAARRSADPTPDDRFRGLHLPDDYIDSLFEPAPQPPAPAAAPAPDGRLAQLAARFGLDEIDTDLLLIALAPDVDARFERFYGYLNDDVSRRRASLGLALDLSPGSLLDRHRLLPGGRLVDAALIAVEDGERPVLTRGLRVPDRVTSYLIGDDRADALIEPLLTSPGGAVEHELLRRGLAAGARLAYVREVLGGPGMDVAITALGSAIALDMSRLAPSDDVVAVANAAGREARLRGAGLVAGPVDALSGEAVRALAQLDCTVVLVGARGWEPGWSRTPPLLVEQGALTHAARSAAWTAHLGEDAAHAASGFRLTATQIRRAVETARLSAAAADRAVTAADLRAGARAQNAAGLDRLARRITPDASWDDLVLPDGVTTQLHELASRALHRDRVLDEWRMGGSSSRGRGITALFAGDSGTGKTMSAEVVAGDLGLDLYVIDLSSVIDKYVGETEKNLDRIFGEADRVNGVLLFDEADALFGKRSEVRDSHDRYANVEVAYLLQRMERFDGLAILTTNLRANVDEAFVRRLDVLVDFPAPEVEERERLWTRQLRDELPLASDIDIAFLAKAFRLSGGEIRNIAVTAAYAAASSGSPVTMCDVIRATQTEYRKIGRLCVEAEFGPYFAMLA